MKNKILLQANYKQHKGSMLGIFMMMMVVSLVLITVLSIWFNSNSYLEDEMDRMNYGTITAWTHSLQSKDPIYQEIAQLADVETLSIQPLLYTNYEIHGQQSDSEGQLLAYEPKQFPYRIFNALQNGYERNPITIKAGEIYISPSLLSTFDIGIGDDIAFPIGRQNMIRTFKIKGTFEDPFMGSSMIGMKSFLISLKDFNEINTMINDAGINALARLGQMVHIKQASKSTLNNAQFNQLLNEKTELGEYVEFVHSKTTMMGFMLILQHVFSGLSLVFAFILLIVSLCIMGYSIKHTIDQDEIHMGILKAIGYDGRSLRNVMKQQYLIVILGGFMMGVLLSCIIIPILSEVMVSFAGILTPSTVSRMVCGVLFLIMSIFFYLFIHFKTTRITKISPIQSIQRGTENEYKGHIIPIKKQFLLFQISLRQLVSGKKRYISVVMTSALLVFMLSMIGRMNTWLGPDGKGMMDAFNPADLDVGVQRIGNQSVEEMEDIIQQYTSIRDSYRLAMESITLNGVDYTANVIDEPTRFHIQQGRTIENPNEIVITDTIASDTNLKIGGNVSVSYNGKQALYTVVGIYQCANDMGGNIGMRRDGFLRIGDERADMWCHHYFLQDLEQKQSIMDALNTRYAGDVYIHENTWPGLFGIITAMQALLMTMYIVTVLFILMVTTMCVHNVFQFERRNLLIYKALGFTTAQLRFTFAIRYGVIATIGAIMGSIISALFGDQLVGVLMNLYGISNFVAYPSIWSILLPGIMIIILFTCFAYLTSRKISKLNMSDLVSP